MVRSVRGFTPSNEPLPPGTYSINEDTCGVSQKIEIQGGATTFVRLSITNAC